MTTDSLDLEKVKRQRINSSIVGNKFDELSDYGKSGIGYRYFQVMFRFRARESRGKKIKMLPGMLHFQLRFFRGKQGLAHLGPICELGDIFSFEVMQVEENRYDIYFHKGIFSMC